MISPCSFTSGSPSILPWACQGGHYHHDDYDEYDDYDDYDDDDYDDDDYDGDDDVLSAPGSAKSRLTVEEEEEAEYKPQVFNTVIAIIVVTIINSPSLSSSSSSP